MYIVGRSLQSLSNYLLQQVGDGSLFEKTAMF